MLLHAGISPHYTFCTVVVARNSGNETRLQRARRTYVAMSTLGPKLPMYMYVGL